MQLDGELMNALPGDTQTPGKISGAHGTIQRLDKALGAGSWLFAVAPPSIGIRLVRTNSPTPSYAPPVHVITLNQLEFLQPFERI